MHITYLKEIYIYIYVVSQEEYDRYKEVLDAKFYCKLVIGVKGLIQQRQYIMAPWTEGKHIAFIDDDVASIDLSMSDLFKEQTLGYLF